MRTRPVWASRSRSAASCTSSAARTSAARFVFEADAAAEVAAEATLSGVRVTLVDLDHEPDTAERSEEPAELIGPQGVVAEHRCLVRETGAFVARAEGRVGGEELTGVEAKERRAVVAVVDEADRRLAAVTTDSSRRRSSGDKGTAGYPPQAGR